MADRILGYEVASPEQQRKTALALIGGACLLAVLLFFGFSMISRWETSGRQQAMATITHFDTKCRYVVRNVGRRVSYYDHTGYIDCPTAHAVAEQNNNPLGQVQTHTVAAIEFMTADGRQVQANVMLRTSTPDAVGRQVEILYRTDKPTDVKEFTKIATLTAKSLAPEQEATTETLAPRKPRASDNYSPSTIRWIGTVVLIVMLFIAYFAITRFFRLIKWLVFGPADNRKPPAPTTTGAPAARLGSATRRPRPAGLRQRPA
ncbi:MAG: hypothetical protein RLZ98_1879 [Pseudomonadota bacterium]|jgi:hypothetical protein